VYHFVTLSLQTIGYILFLQNSINSVILMDLILQYMTYLNDIIIEVPTNFYIYQLCMSYDGEFNFVANSFPSTKINFVEKSICVYVSDISAIAV
jgi:hypothetical protein